MDHALNVIKGKEILRKLFVKCCFDFPLILTQFWWHVLHMQ